MSEKNKLQEHCQKNKWPMPLYETWSDGPPHCLQWFAKVTIKANGKILSSETTVPTNSKNTSEKQVAVLMMNLIKNKSSSMHRSPKRHVDRENREAILDDPQQLVSTTKLNSHSSHQTDFKFLDSVGILDANIDLDPLIENPFEDNDSDTENSYDIGSLSESKSSTNNIYLIDLENKPCFNKTYNPDAIYIGFINSIHHSIERYASWHKCSSDNISYELEISHNNKLLYLIEGGITDLVDHFITAFVYPLVMYLQKPVIYIVYIVYIVSGDHAGWCTRACLEKILAWHKLSNVSVKNSISI